MLNLLFAILLDFFVFYTEILLLTLVMLAFIFTYSTCKAHCHSFTSGFHINVHLHLVNMNFVVYVFTGSNYTPQQNSQSQSASSTCGHWPGLLPTGCITECLHMSAAEGVSLQTVYTQQTTQTQCLPSFVLCCCVIHFPILLKLRFKRTLTWPSRFKRWQAGKNKTKKLTYVFPSVWHIRNN